LLEEARFDVIVIGGGTFGSVVAEHLFVTDNTRSRRILVLEAGPFVLPEHFQNMPFMGGAPDMRVPWVNHPALNYSGLIFAIGGRSLTWGGWSLSCPT
jgi:choline dehydrogenase-like flavoprotein